jgi:hypothetical protein
VAGCSARHERLHAAELHPAGGGRGEGSLVSGLALDVSNASGWATFTVPPIPDHDVLVIG